MALHLGQRLHAFLIGLKGPKGNFVGKTLIENMLANPFYVGLIHIKKTNKTYSGQHPPLVDMTTFKRVADVRAGRHFKKRVKYDHVFRRVFRCADCGKSFIAERQKGHVYYRCHTTKCPSEKLREDRITSALMKRLRRLVFSEPNNRHVEEQVTSWIENTSKNANPGLLAARLRGLAQQKDQLLDLLLNGTIDQETYERRHRDLLVSEREAVQNSQEHRSEHDLRTKATELVELFKNPYFTYLLATNGEKRQLLELLFSNRSISGKELLLTTNSWVEEAQDALGVLFGPPVPDTNRNSHNLGEPALANALDVLNSTDMSAFLELARSINARRTQSDLPKVPDDAVFDQAA